MSQKQELGKGLQALLSNINKDQKPKSNAEVVITEQSIVQLMPLSKIKANPHQPRNHFDDDKINELAESLKNFGIIQPITVRKINADEYQIISGERRFRAAHLAGLKEIPSYIRSANDQELLEMALIENIQREDLNPMEIAISYQMLIEEFKLTHEVLADRVGKKRSTVTNYTRLLRLPPEVQSAVKANTLSMGHARILAGIEDIMQQLIVYKEIQSKSLSVRAAEEFAAQLQRKNARKPVGETKSPTSELKSIENKISEFFGAKAIITRNSKGEGNIMIKFKSDESFNEILDRINI
jgi:ParB family chromosome partitioning protein